jgi:putative phage-type endonuclease
MATKTRANWRTPDAVRVDVDENTDRTAWLRQRRAGIGGTDITALMGTHTAAMTPEAVYDEKVSTDEPVEADRPWFRFGHLLEPRLIAESSDHHGITVRPGGLFRNKSESWRYANPDALTSDGGILECKTTGKDTKAAEDWRDGIVSAHAYDQTQWYLAVTGRAHARWVVGINPPGWRKMPESEWVDAVEEVLHVGPIERDEDRIAELLDAARDFWACVEARHLSTRWKPREVEAAIPQMVADDLKRLAVIKGQQDKLKAEREAIEKRMKDEIGKDGGFLTVGGIRRVKWSHFPKERFDKKGLEAAHPDLVREYTSTYQGTLLTILGGDA